MRKKKLTNPTGEPLLEADNECLTTTRRTAAAEFLTIDDWASRLQLCKRTIFRMIDERIIPPYDLAVGKTRRWHISTYERWVADHVGGV